MRRWGIRNLEFGMKNDGGRLEIVALFLCLWYEIATSGPWGQALRPPPKKLKNRIRHNIRCKCFNKNMLSQYYRNLSFFCMHPENPVRCSQ